MYISYTIDISAVTLLGQFLSELRTDYDCIRKEEEKTLKGNGLEILPFYFALPSAQLAQHA